MHCFRRPVVHLDDLIISITETVNEVRVCVDCFVPLADQSQLSNRCTTCSEDRGIW